MTQGNDHEPADGPRVGSFSITNLWWWSARGRSLCNDAHASVSSDEAGNGQSPAQSGERQKPGHICPKEQALPAMKGEEEEEVPRRAKKGPQVESPGWMMVRSDRVAAAL